jgi:phytoene synthase
VSSSTSETEQAFRAARDICRRHARSFYFSSAFLNRAKRDGSYAVYAFCRMIDDAIDQDDQSIESTEVGGWESGAGGRRVQPDPRPTTHDPRPTGCCSTSALEQRLQLFRARLDDIYQNRLQLPLLEHRSETQHALHAFALTVHRYEIPQQYFLDLAEGCRMDLTISRYATWNSLERYCYHVAGVVGLMMSCVFGLTHSDAKHNAIAMGNAMQLTNILRDVKEDWDRGRVYLPLEDMARFGYSERDLSRGVVNESFRDLMRFEIDRARQLFRAGADGLCWLAGDGSRLTASAMAVIYSGILGAIERQNYDVFSRRAHLSFGQKLARVPRAWKLARRMHEHPLPHVFDR